MSQCSAKIYHQHQHQPSSKRIPTARRSTSNRRVASGPTSEHTLIVLRRDDITLVAQAYFAMTRDTLDAARVGDRGAIVTAKKTLCISDAEGHRDPNRHVRRTRYRTRDNRRSCLDPPTDRRTRTRRDRVRRARGTPSVTRDNDPVSPRSSGPHSLCRHFHLPERSALPQTALRGAEVTDAGPGATSPEERALPWSMRASRAMLRLSAKAVGKPQLRALGACYQ